MPFSLVLRLSVHTGSCRRRRTPFHGTPGKSAFFPKLPLASIFMQDKVFCKNTSRSRPCLIAAGNQPAFCKTFAQAPQ
jgi:hypothetical protein